MRTKALWAVIAIVITTIVFIAIAFRHVSRPISSWIYGFVAILTLAHDIIIPAGAYAFLAEQYAWEVDVLFVMALLAILGLSINDTIVVFDRIRENLKENEAKHVQEPFEETVGKSLKETYARSINTSLTTIITLLVLYFVGAETTRNFAFTMAVGMIVGTYSSIFVAAPLLVVVNNWRKSTHES